LKIPKKWGNNFKDASKWFFLIKGDGKRKLDRGSSQTGKNERGIK